MRRFALLPLLALASLSLVSVFFTEEGASAAHVYTGSVQTATTSGSSKQTLVSEQAWPSGVATDGTYLYWSNALSDSIGRSNMDGSGADPTWISGNFVSPRGIIIHGSYLYWINQGSWTISRANLDGSGLVANFIGTGRGPVSLAANDSHLYWTRVDGYDSFIAKANLDGSGADRTWLAAGNSTTNRLGWAGIAASNAHIFWGMPGRIDRINTDGTGRVNDFILLQGQNNARSLSISGGKIYWTREGSGQIGVADTDGSNVNQELIQTDPALLGLAVYASDVFWTVQKEPVYNLFVENQGPGVISGGEGKIFCGRSCSSSYPEGSALSFLATPNPGAIFLGYGGDCSGSTCSPVVGRSEIRISGSFEYIPLVWKQRPARKTEKRRAFFRYEAEGASGYSCTLDGKRTHCTSSFQSKRLSPGRHRFEVVAIYSGQEADRRSWTWRVLAAKKPSPSMPSFTG